MRIVILSSVLGLIASCSVITGVDPDKKKESSAILDLVVTVTKPGTGKEAVNGKRVHMHYTGWLYDTLATGKKGKKFDSSHDRGKPFVFTLGKGQVIKGWDQGVLGMKEGEQRQFIIPSRLGYGIRGAGRAIPGGSTLVFDVELMQVD